MKTINGVSVKSIEVQEALEVFGLPLNSSLDSIHLLDDGTEEDGTPRILLAVCMDENNFHFKPYNLLPRKDGGIFWYQRLWLTRSDLEKVNDFVKSGGVDKMLASISNREAIKQKIIQEREIKKQQYQEIKQKKAAEQMAKYNNAVKAKVQQKTVNTTIEVNPDAELLEMLENK